MAVDLKVLLTIQKTGKGGLFPFPEFLIRSEFFIFNRRGRGGHRERKEFPWALCVLCELCGKKD